MKLREEVDMELDWLTREELPELPFSGVRITRRDYGKGLYHQIGIVLYQPSTREMDQISGSLTNIVEDNKIADQAFR